MIASERTIKDKTTLELRFYISSLPADAVRLNRSIRQHWRVENSVHWCMDVVFGDDRMRARTDNAAHNFAVMRHFALNLPTRSFKAQGRPQGATSDRRYL